MPHAISDRNKIGKNIYFDHAIVYSLYFMRLTKDDTNIKRIILLRLEIFVANSIYFDVLVFQQSKYNTMVDKRKVI